jgi:membrane protease YdiL (CAAX protease family)
VHRIVADRQVASAGRGAAAISAVVLGAALLWATFHTERGSTAFWLVGYALAAVWVVGAAAVGGVRPGRASVAPLLASVGVGIAAFGVVYASSRLLADVPVLGGALDRVEGTADAAHVGAVLLLAVVNAVSEELFFRGALASMVRPSDAAMRTILTTTVVYALVTAASLNVALVLAAVGMGLLFAVLAWWSRGVIAPSVCHVVWSTLMLVALHR